MRSHHSPNLVLRGILAVFGAGIIFLGLNVGLGGIETLGWQGGTAPFLTITDPALFAVRDSHIRFIGGVWLGVGLLMLAGSIAFQHMRILIVALLGLIVIGGLARFSGDLSVLATPAIAPSLLIELIAAPLLGLWVLRAERNDRREVATANRSSDIKSAA